MLLVLNNIYKFFLSLLGFNRFLLIIVISLVLQVVLFQLVNYFSYFYFLFLELWVFLIILFFKPVKTDLTFFIFIFYVLLFTSFLISILLLSDRQEGAVLLLFLFIVLKVLFFSLIIYIFLDKDFIVLNRFVLIVYIFNFKLFLLLFVLFLFNSRASTILLIFFLDFSYLFVLFWVVFFLIIVRVLLSEGLEKYLFIILNLSHYILFLSCFLNIRIFLYCSFLDCLICFLVSQFIGLKHANLNKSLLDKFTSLFLFLFACHSFGIPPFPSFVLELCFLFTFFKVLGLFFGYIFLFLFYFITCLNFIFIFRILGIINNNHCNYILSDIFVLLLVLFLGIFVFCSLNFYTILEI